MEQITTNLLNRDPENKANLMKLALDHIRRSNNIHDVFHIRHVENTGRLRSGYDQIVKRRNKLSSHEHITTNGFITR